MRLMKYESNITMVGIAAQLSHADRRGTKAKNHDTTSNQKNRSRKEHRAETSGGQLKSAYGGRRK
jgi:hypothetical protein